MFHLPDFQRVVQGSGLTKSEIATVYGVARQTIYTWLEGSPPREGSPMDRMAFTITLALLHAMRQHTLPLPQLDKTLRSRRVATMSRVMQNLKPAAVK